MDKETIINATLLREIETYCELNGEDTTSFVNKLLKRAYMEEKYQDMLSRPTPEEPKKEVVKNTPPEPPKPVEKKESDVKPEPRRGLDINKDLYGE